MNSSFKQTKWVSSKKQLACEDTLPVGHLLCSLRSINAEDCKQAFWEKHQIDLSSRWRVMQVEKGKCEKYEDLTQAPRALQIEVNKSDAKKAGEVFRNEYSSKKTDGFLLGMRFRFIPDKESLVSANASEKLWQATPMQSHFVNKINDEGAAFLDNIATLNTKIRRGTIKVALHRN